MIFKVFFISIIILVINEVFILGNFTKCCPENKKLNSTLNGCVSAYNNSDINYNISDFNSNTSFYNVSSIKVNLRCMPTKIKNLMSDEYDIIENSTLVPKLAIGVEKFMSNEYCLDDAVDFVSKVALTCPCLRGTCVHVCCNPGYVMVHNNETEKLECEEASRTWSNWSHDQYASPYERNYSIIYNIPPSCSKYASLVIINHQINESGYLSDPSDNVTILGNGSFYGSTKEYNNFELSPSTYCIGLLSKDDEVFELVEVACHDTETEEERQEQKINTAIYTTLFILGDLFLLATLVVHILLSELRSTARGLSLMLHCACMLVAYITLAFVQQRGHNLEDISCHVLAYTIQFSLLAGFFWMNVMCINISLTFRSLQRLIVDVNTLQRDNEELKKFLYYGIYATSVPIIISAITIWANDNDAVPENIQPKIGLSRCWFGIDEENNYGLLVYFYGPMGFLLLINLGLFIFTFIKISSYSRPSVMLNRHNSQRHARSDPHDKRLVLFLKLFGLMGIPWIMEIISWMAGGNAAYWYVTDAINLLRSALIFYMFCCTPEVLQLLKTKYSRCMNTAQEAPRNLASRISKKFMKRSASTSPQQHPLEMENLN